MNFKLLVCALFGHDFTEHRTSKDEYNGKWYITETQEKCERCQMSSVDISGSLGLAKIKYNMDCKGAKLQECSPQPSV